jgi:NitT/TauT family transport system substrate-binding protein
MAQMCGPVPWSVYYTSPRVLERKDGMAAAFVASLQQALDWIHAHGDDEVAEGIASYFPGKPRALLGRSIGRLRADGVWRADTTIPQEPFDAYQRIIADFGLIERPFAFADVVSYPKAA